MNKCLHLLYSGLGFAMDCLGVKGTSWPVFRRQGCNWDGSVVLGAIYLIRLIDGGSATL